MCAQSSLLSSLRIPAPANEALVEPVPLEIKIKIESVTCSPSPLPEQMDH